MSIQTTPFLHLPQWTADEKPSFLGEINQSWKSIDDGYGEIKTIAQTAHQTATGAQSTAQQSLTQSQANAGAITSLQQEHAQLEADFVNARYLNTLNAEITPSSGITGPNAIFTYNGFVTHFHFVCTITPGTYNPNEQGDIPLATVTNIPFIYKSLNFHSNLVYSNGRTIYRLKMANNIISIDTNSALTITTATVVTGFTAFPITHQIARTLEDNCIYITKL